MASRCFKSLLVAAFSLSGLFFFNVSNAQDSAPGVDEQGKKEAPRLDPAKIILEHVADGHEFHFYNFNKKPVSIPLPVIL
jgi:F-type H+-transporting ATPase subunit a